MVSKIHLILSMLVLMVVSTTVDAQMGFNTGMFIKTQSFSLSYDANGATSGTVPTDVTAYASGSTVTVSSNSGSLVRTGYTFGGWNTQADGNGTNYTASTGTFTMGAANVTLYAKWNVSCGDSTANNCYSGTNAATLKTAGSVTTPLGKSLTWNTSTLVWEESGAGTRVLEVNGTDAWQMQLAANGRSWVTTALDKANVGGRACPTNVYVSDSNMVATGRCLYYDSGNVEQRLDATVNDGATDQSTAGAYRLGSWNTASGGNSEGASWYEGNIQTCAAKGMRLPTLYETTAPDPAGSYKPTDATPTGWGSGVPHVGTSSTWTASAYTWHPNDYWVWSGTSTGGSNYNTGYAVRCVVQ